MTICNAFLLFRMSNISSSFKKITPRRQGRRPNSLVWEHFSRPSKEEGYSYVICNFCKEKLSYCESTGNLLNHLRRRHAFINTDSVHTSNLTASQVTEGSGSGTKQKKLETFFKSKSISRQRQNHIDKLIVNVIIGDMRPINIVEGEHFRNLISNLEPGYEMPGRTFFGKQIETTYSQYKCKLMSILKEQNVISITTDAWTSIRMEAYITVTAHFVMAGELQNYVLSTTQIVGDQTGINLKSYILYVLNDFSIPPSSIFAIVTDNGANVVSACKILQTEHGWHHIRCAAHTLQLCIKDAIKNTEIARALGK
uniref:zinc finger BED domain-containing protein RICESLEEPER 3-like isoform X2 n=1 Tax=Styela clava TaxID=7725 RepID=UPI00193ADC88|nr:zinc finger BED domain-containing protein RICESLEEPER 3-like isoform X2 [Styela clava]